MRIIHPKYFNREGACEKPSSDKQVNYTSRWLRANQRWMVPTQLLGILNSIFYEVMQRLCFCHYHLYAITPNECKPRLPFHKPLARVLQQHSAEREAGARLKPPWLLSPDARCDFLQAPGVHSLGRNPCPVVAWISGHGEVEAWRRSRRERVIITDIWHSDWAAASCVSALTPCLCMLTVMCDRAPLAVNHIHTLIAMDTDGTWCFVSLCFT